MYQIEITFKVILDESRLPDPQNLGNYVLMVNTSSAEFGFLFDTELKEIGLANEVSFRPRVKVTKIGPIMSTGPDALLKGIQDRYPDIFNEVAKIVVTVQADTKVVSSISMLPVGRKSDILDFQAWDNASRALGAISAGDAVIFIHIGDREDGSIVESSEVVDTLVASLGHQAADPRVLDVLWLNKDPKSNILRWGSFLCKDSDCCGPEGTALN